MNLCYSRSSILFIEPLAKYSSIFGIAPLFDFQNLVLQHEGKFKCYSIVLAAFIATLSLGGLFIKSMVVYQHICKIISLLDFLLEVGGLLLFEATLIGTLWNMDSWKKLLKLLSDLESEKNLDTRKAKCKRVLSNTYFIFFMGNIHVLSLYIYQIIYGPSVGWLGVPLVATQDIFLYFSFVLSNLIFNIALSIRHKYEGINNFFNGFRPYDLNADLLKTMKRVKEMYLITEEIIEAFNKVFGRPLLFLLFLSLLKILFCLTLAAVAVQSFKWMEYEFKVSGDIHFLILYSGLATWICCVFVIFSCDMAIKEPMKLLTSCYRLEEILRLTSEEKEELKSLKYTIVTKYPVFTASGFFEIKRSNLLSLISAITSYFIVCLQFKSF